MYIVNSLLLFLALNVHSNTRPQLALQKWEPAGRIGHFGNIFNGLAKSLACEQALCLGKKIPGKGGGGRACRQTFEAAIPPSCNYLAEHQSVRSLSVYQFRAWVTPGTGNEPCFAPSQNKVKWTASLIVDFAKNGWSPVRELNTF